MKVPDVSVHVRSFVHAYIHERIQRGWVRGSEVAIGFLRKFGRDPPREVIGP